MPWLNQTPFVIRKEQLQKQ
jgi:hypothetical protein